MLSVLRDEPRCQGADRRSADLAMDRIVGRCLAGELEISSEQQPARWPLERRLPAGGTTLPIACFSPAEVLGGYVRLRFQVIGQSGAVIHAGAVLPAVAYDVETNSYTLQLDEPRQGYPGMQMARVPAGCLEIVLGVPWERCGESR